MKIDSEYLDMDINPEFSIQYGTLKTGQDFEVYQDGDIVLYADTPMINVKVMEEMVRVSKLFISRRITYLEKSNKT